MFEDPRQQPGTWHGAPFPPYGAPKVDEPPLVPLPLGEAIRQLPRQYIRVLIKPGAAIFAREQGKAAWNIVWAQVIIIGVVSAVVGWFIYNVTLPIMLSNLNVLYSQMMPPAMAQQMQSIFQMFNVLTGPTAFSFLLITPILLFIRVGIYHLLAKLFGGQGSFLAFMYCYLLFGVPLGLVADLFALIPWVGSYVGSAAGIYLYVLLGFMTMAVHRLSGWKAVTVVLIPVGISLVIGLVAGYFLAMYLLTHMMPFIIHPAP